MGKRTTDEIKRAANRLIIETLEDLAQKRDLRILPNEYHEEIGKDYSIEFRSRADDANEKVYGTCYLQNKGTDDPVEVNTRGPNAGLISFQLEKLMHIEYFCLEVDQPLIILLCDLQNKSIYWLPIQLFTERYIQELKKLKTKIAANERKTDAMQIYFDPARYLLKDNVSNVQNFDTLIDDIRRSKEYLVQRFKSKGENYFKASQNSQRFRVKQGSNIIDQMYDYFNFKFKELNFVPAELWINEFPISGIESDKVSTYSGFVLKPGNTLLTSLFKSIQFVNGAFEILPEFQAISDVQNKLSLISKQLRRLGVVYLDDGRRKHIEVPNTSNQKCNCVSCSFDKLKFKESLSSLQAAENGTLLDQLKRAYVLYKFGHFTKAVEILQRCAITTSENREHEWFCITKYNLSKLGRSLQNFAWGDEKQTKLADDLNTIDLDNVLPRQHEAPNYEALEALASGNFFTRPSLKINELSTNIRAHYYAQLNGNSGSNNYVWELLTEFDQLESFIHHNYIAFEGFSDFNTLFRKIIEGVFASHAINDRERDRLQSFSERLILNFVRFGDADTIISLFKRYNLKELEYSSNDASDYNFVNLISNFFRELPLIKEELDFSSNLFFRQRAHKTFATLMSLAGILKLEVEKYQTIYSLLGTFLRTGVMDNSHFLKYAQYFIARRGKHLDTETTKSLLSLSYENFDFYGEDFVETLASQLEISKVSNFLTLRGINEYVDLVKNNDTESFAISLAHLHSACDKTTQDQISLHITEQLKVKFSDTLFYLATIRDVISIDSDQFNAYIASSQLKENQVSMNMIFGNKNKRFPHLGAMFNLAFKVGADTSLEKFKPFKGIDPYYDWLLDMDGFDYEQFDPRWITEYDTTHFVEKMKQYPKIQTKTLEYLKVNKDPVLQNYFIKRFL